MTSYWNLSDSCRYDAFNLGTLTYVFNLPNVEQTVTMLL